MWFSPNAPVEKTDLIAAAKMAGIQYLKERRALDIPDIFLLALSPSRKLTYQLRVLTHSLFWLL